MDLITFLVQAPIMAALVLFLTEVISKKVPLNGWGAKLATWALSIGLVFVSDYIPVAAMFVGLSVVAKLIYGVLIGVISNGIFSIEEIQTLLEKLGIRTYMPSKAAPIESDASRFTSRPAPPVTGRPTDIE